MKKPAGGNRTPATARDFPRWPFAAALIAPALVAWLWDEIAVPYANPYAIAGLLAELRISPLTNAARFAAFVFVPAIVWLILVRRPIAFRPAAGDPMPDARAHRRLTIVLGIGLAWAVVSAAVLFARDVSSGPELDWLHDGDHLVPALRYATSGELWTVSAITRGAGSDVVPPLAAWWLFDRQTIAGYHVLQWLVKALLPIAWWLVVFIIQRNLRDVMAPAARAVFAAIAYAGPAVAFWMLPFPYAVFGPRGLAGMAWVVTFVIALRRRSPAWFGAAGAVTAAALLTSADVGVYCGLAGLCVLVSGAAMIGWRRAIVREALPWLGGLILGHVLTFVAFGPDEYFAWTSQVAAAASRWDYVYGLPYPSPALPAFWATHAWQITAVALLVLGLALAWRTKGAGDDVVLLARVHVLLVAIGVIGYRTALGRADHAHVTQGLAYNWLALAFTIAWLSRASSPRARWSIAVLATAFLAVATLRFLPEPGLRDVFGAGDRAAAHLRTSDDAMVGAGQGRVLARLRALTAGDQCAFVFPNEPAWYFLLRKPACVPQFITAHIAGRDLEQDAVQTLSAHPPAYVLYESPNAATVIDGIPNAERLRIVNAWIRSRYEPFEIAEGHVILRLRR